MTKKNRSLKTILSFYVGAVIGVSNIIFAIAAGYTAIGKVDKVSTQMYLENTKVCAEKMSGWMDKQIRTVDSFVEAIKAGKYDTENFDKAEDYLAEVVTVDEDIYAMYMGRPDKSGVFSDRWDAAAEGYDPTIRDWYIKALETDKAVISEPYNDVSTNQQVITVSKAIRSADGELTAVLASDIFVTSIVEMAAEISNGKDTYPILLDANNNIVVHKESSYIPVTDEQGNDIVTNIEETNVPECVTAENNTIFTTKDYDGTLSVFAKQQVGNTGWHLIVSTVATTFYADNNSIILLYGGIFVFFLIWDTVAMGIIIRKRLAPLNELTLASSAMLEGKLSYVSKYRSGDEIGTACVSTEEATKKILSYINDIDAKLASMADGDFTNSVELDYIGDFVNIKNSLIAIQSSLRNTFGGIIQITNEVADGATQLSAASNELSIGATKQTSAIDSLSASLSSASEIVTATVENAKVAEGIASEMSNSVSECTTSMSELIEAMNRITTTSEEIKKINKSIEDIAFQTNILALNASVEAARAGDAGKGFAVVADEVRNLANKSSDAANTSARLIAESSEAVEKGMEYTKITADSLESLVDGTKRTIEVINAIVSDANNEEEKLSHVTSELNEISAVVQDNTATAEETAAASSSLQGQAADLNSKISRFRC